MLGPIPNSLGAGAYNGSFIPHGLVTFSTRGQLVVVFQEVCLDAVIHSTIAAIAVLNPTLAVVAVLHPDQAINADLHGIIATDSQIHDRLVLVATIEECN